MTATSAKEKFMQEKLRLEKEAKEWDLKVQAKQAIDKAKATQEVEAQRIAAKAQERLEELRRVEEYEKTVIPKKAEKLTQFELEKMNALKQEAERRLQQELEQQKEMFRKQQEAIEQQEAQKKAYLQGEYRERLCKELVDQEVLFRRQIEAEEGRALDKLDTQEEGERDVLRKAMERDSALKQKAESVARMEEERRWNKLTPEQRLAELASRLASEESLLRSDIVVEEAKIRANLAEQWEAVQPVAKRFVCWRADSSYPACSSCLSRFGLFRRRHHCRRCGEVVCAACSSNKGTPVAHNAMYGRPKDKPCTEDSARVCDRCFLNPNRQDIEWYERSELWAKRQMADEMPVDEDWVFLHCRGA